MQRREEKKLKREQEVSQIQNRETAFRRRFSEYRIFKYIKPYIAVAVMAIFVDVAGAAATAGIAFKTKDVLDTLQGAYQKDDGTFTSDEAQRNEHWDKLLNIGFLLGGLAIVIAGSEYGKEYFKRYIANKVDFDLRTDLVSHLTRLQMSFFNDRRNGELLSNMTNDISVSTGALLLVFDVISVPLRILVTMGAAFILHPIFGFLMLAMLPMIYLPAWKYRRKIRKASGDRLSRLADLTQDMSQLLTGIRTVKAFSMEDEENQEFRQLGRQVLRKSMKATRAKAAASALSTLLSRFGGVLIMVGAGYVIIFHASSIGLGTPRDAVNKLITFVLLSTTSYTAVKSFAKDYTNLQEYLPGSERLFRVFDVNPDIQDHPDAVPLPGVNGSIVFRNVRFGYNDTPVLHDINLSVDAGRAVAIVGHSGAGKSTLLDLVPRFYDPQQGSIEIDGYDIRRVTHESLLDKIAIVSQQPFLFNTTIAANIRYGRREATMDEIIAAAKAANIHDFIVSLPDGYDSVTGEQGVRLSGGQRQRITIARAILKNAPILILDEATSSLDNESEKLVQAALNNLMQNRTTFVIAHRLSTVQHADMIIVLKDGRIVERGRHGELLTADGEYARLYKSQIVDA